MSRAKLPAATPNEGCAPGPAVVASGDDALANLAWAVAHPARVRLLRILIDRRSCVCGELVEAMPLANRPSPST